MSKLMDLGFINLEIEALLILVTLLGVFCFFSSRILVVGISLVRGRGAPFTIITFLTLEADEFCRFLKLLRSPKLGV